MSPRPIMVAIMLLIAIVAAGGQAAAQSMSEAPLSQAPTGAGEVETVQPFDTLDINVLQLDSLRSPIHRSIRATLSSASSKTRRFIRDFAPIAPLVYLIPHP